VDLAVERVVGMSYNPFTRAYSLGEDASVNYILSARRGL
jgi:2-polyprenyl-6-hydroxyphenyl methylase/3-demethylubiquinone-9 3-methyltransferase